MKTGYLRRPCHGLRAGGDRSANDREAPGCGLALQIELAAPNLGFKDKR
jgi:hypothetical protein